MAPGYSYRLIRPNMTALCPPLRGEAEAGGVDVWRYLCKFLTNKVPKKIEED